MATTSASSVTSWPTPSRHASTSTSSGQSSTLLPSCQQSNKPAAHLSAEKKKRVFVKWPKTTASEAFCVLVAAKLTVEKASNTLCTLM